MTMQFGELVKKNIRLKVEIFKQKTEQIASSYKSRINDAREMS